MGGGFFLKAIMTDAAFFSKIETLSLKAIAELIGAELPDDADGAMQISDVAPIDTAAKGARYLS